MVVTGVVAATATGTLTNSATASSATPDPAPGNNTGTASDPIGSRADVSLSKTATPSPVLAGNQVTYTLTVAQQRAVDRAHRGRRPTRSPLR